MSELTEQLKTATRLVHKFDNVKGSIDIEDVKIISVVSRKYARVDLCIKSNMHLPFARIKLYSSQLAVDAEACYESAKALSQEIERRWNSHDAQQVKIDALLEACKAWEIAVTKGEIKAKGFHTEILVGEAIEKTKEALAITAAEVAK